MALYANGRIPKSLLVKDRYGNPWLPGTYAKWIKFQQLVHDRTGVWLYVTPKGNGAYNTYRDYDGQVALRSWWASIGMPLMASIAGRSSHGGLWTGQTNGRYGLPTYVVNRTSGAFDVANWAAVPWDVFEECANTVGLKVNVTVPEERWHVVDLDPWNVPAVVGQPADAGSFDTSEEDTMPEHENKSYKGAQALEQARAWPIRLSGTDKKPEHRFAATHGAKREVGQIELVLVFSGGKPGDAIANVRFEHKGKARTVLTEPVEVVASSGGTAGQVTCLYDLPEDFESRVLVQALQPGVKVERVEYRKNYWRS